jgi:hypothetical protein
LGAIAILSSDELLLQRISDALVLAGYDTVARLIRPSTTVGELAQFIGLQEPKAIVFDLRPQVEDRTRFLQQLWAHRGLPKVPFVLAAPPQASSQIPYRHGVAVAVLRDGTEAEAVVSAVEQTCSSRMR